ncbi:MAG: hypothetical protein J0L66_00835 [Cytophagales bacterium]|nr:hypothetical protein [Cytophagales bacterium]
MSYCSKPSTKWPPDFTIKLSHTGSMSGSSLHIEYTYEQCTYLQQSLEGKPLRYSFPLTEAMREEILAKMQALKIENIKSNAVPRVVHDGWSEMLCVGTRCVEGGTRGDLSQADKAIFLEAVEYLQQFAVANQPK